MLIQIHKTSFKIGKLLEVFSLLSVFILMLSGCGLFEKPDPYKWDKEHHRFFRCKINGKEWSNAGYDWFYGDQSSIAYYSNTYSVKERRGGMNINMDYEPSEYVYEALHLYIIKDSKLGINLITTKNNIPTFSFLKPHPYIDYFLDKDYNNFIEIIEMDSINSIIKGKFEFRAMTEDKTDTIMVTDGEFDWHVNWYK